MKSSHSRSNSSTRSRILPGQMRFSALAAMPVGHRPRACWSPQYSGWFEAALTELRQIRSLNGLAESLSALGGTVQILLGLMLVLAGVGLLWQVVSAWTLSVLLLVITVGVKRSPGTMGFESRPPDHSAGCLVVGEASLQAPGDSAQPCVLVEQHRRDPGLWPVWQLSAGERFSSRKSRPGHSVYFTITTLSTVAFDDIVPVTSAARWFVISLVVIGLGVFSSAIASVLGPEI